MPESFPRASWQMAAVRLAYRLLGKTFGRDEAAFRRRFEHRPPPVPARVSWRLRRRCEVVEADLNGHVVYTLTPRRGRQERHLIYTHGGGYVKPLIWPHWDVIDQLIAATGATVTVPLYPLAPEHTHREALPWLAEVYRRVLATTPAERVMLCGDSAGGGLALAQTLHFRELGLPLPGRLVLFSPWLDVTVADPAAAAYEAFDVMLAIPTLRLAGRWWAGEASPHDPLVSPLHASLDGLPPITVFQSADEVLAPDVRTFARRAGTLVQLHEYPRAIHDFVCATFTPEARDVYARIAALEP